MNRKPPGKLEERERERQRVVVVFSFLETAFTLPDVAKHPLHLRWLRPKIHHKKHQQNANSINLPPSASSLLSPITPRTVACPQRHM